MFSPLFSPSPRNPLELKNYTPATANNKSSIITSWQEDEGRTVRTKHFQLQKLPLDDSLIVSCIAVHTKFIALGGYDGSVKFVQHSTGALTNQEYHLHSGAINDISIDKEGKYIACCSDDGNVSMFKVGNKKYKTWDFKSGPVKSVVINPNFQPSSGPNQNFVIGHEQLLLSNCEGKTVLLHSSNSGDGRVSTVKWRGNYIAMANEKGIFVYCVTTKDCVGNIKFEQNVGRSPCSLYWMNDGVLLFGYENSVKIVKVKENSSAMNIVTHYVIPNVLICSTVVLLNDVKVVLGYVNQQEDITYGQSVPPYLSATVLDDTFLAESHMSSQEREISEIELMVDRCANDCTRYYEPCNHHLDCVSGSNQIYIQTPRSIIVGHKIDSNEHIDWLISTDNYEKAMKYAEDNAALLAKGKLKETTLIYIRQLIKEKSYKMAAQKCQELLHDPYDWQDIIEKFMELKMLPIIVPYIPKGDDLRLTNEFYQSILTHLLNIPEELCKAVQDWPTDLYNPTLLLNAVTIELNDLEPHSETDAEIYHFKYYLLKVKAKLCEYKGDISSALKIYLRLADPRSFDLIEEKSLYDQLIENLQTLSDQGAERAVKLLVDFHKFIPTIRVVERMNLFLSTEGNKRYLLYRYLNSLFDIDPQACEEFHELQLELYANYNRKKVVQLLKHYSDIDLQMCLEFCTNRKLYEACFYILDCMGNYKAAVEVLVLQLCDIDQAIAYVKEKNDWRLEDELAALLKNYTGIPSSANTELFDDTSKALKEANSHLAQEFSQLQSDYFNLQNEKERQEEMVTDLIQDLSIANDTIETIKQSLQDHIDDYKRLKDRYTLLEKQRSQLRLPNAQQHMQQENTELQTRNTDLRQQNIELSERNTQLTERYTQLERQYSEWRQQYIDVVHQKELIETQLNSFADSRYQMEESLHEAITTISTVERTYKISHTDIIVSDQEMGRGGWGVVWMGEFRGQKVAVKKMHEMLKSREYLNRFNNDVQTMAQLRHPNLLQFIGAVFDHPSGIPMILTEVMDTSLCKAYEQRLVNPDQQPMILSIMRDVAVGLNYLHCLPDPIIHRDVSSANVLLEKKFDTIGKWKTKISDFGTAQRVQSALARVQDDDVYSAPECCHNIMTFNTTHNNKTTKTDVYSYGILLCEAFTCTFPTREAIEALIDQVHGDSASLHYLVMQCTNHTPQNRLTMKQIIAQIKIIELQYRNIT